MYVRRTAIFRLQIPTVNLVVNEVNGHPLPGLETCLWLQHTRFSQNFILITIINPLKQLYNLEMRDFTVFWQTF